MNIKHKKFGEFTIKDPLLQIDIENYSKKLQEMGIDFKESDLFTYSGGCVRAAVQTKILMPEFDVDKTPIGKVRWIWGELQKFIADSLSIDDPS